MQKFLLITVGLILGLISARLIFPAPPCPSQTPLPARVPSTSCFSHNEITCARYVKNYDGDTVTFDIPGMPAVFGDHISVRIRGIDTPEIKGKTLCEKRAAQRAQTEVQSLLARAQRIVLRDIARDKYFRLLADVEADGVSVSQQLLNKKLAYPYFGATKQKRDWCPVAQD